MNPRVAEIQKERQAKVQIMQQALADIAALDKEELEILTGTERTGNKQLTFDSDGKTIRWDDGSITLGKKPCQFVKELYFAEKRRMKFGRIAKAVWGNSLKYHNTIKVTVCNLRKKLMNAKFPYEILSVGGKKHEVEVKNPKTGQVRKITVQPEISGFMFRIKK